MLELIVVDNSKKDDLLITLIVNDAPEIDSILHRCTSHCEMEGKKSLRRGYDVRSD